MNGNQYTQKSMEAIQAAQRTAQEWGHQQLEAAHLLHALVNQKEGLIPQLLQKSGVAVQQMANGAEKMLQKLPRVQVQGREEGKVYVSAHLDKALNAAWFVYGTKKELKEQGIVDERFLAKDRVLQNSDFNKDYFTQIDIRKDKIIKLHSKSAKLLTTHPDGSYEFIKDEKEQQVLLIEDPTEFWSVSRYLVIQVK